MNKLKTLKKPVIYTVAALLLIIAGLYVYGSKADEIYPEYSTYNSKAGGAKALYLLTGQMGYNTSRFERPARLLPQGVTLVVIKPVIEIFTSPMELKYLKPWIEQGNTMILIDEYSNTERLKLEMLDAKYLEPGDSAANADLFTVSKGKVYFLEDAGVYINNGLKGKLSAVDFINTVDLAGNKNVIFNEYVHGMGARGITFIDLLGTNGILIGLQLAFALIVYLLIKSKRFGKPAVVLETVKRQENENIYALSNLYMKAKAGSLVLETYLDFFKKRLSRFLGYSYIPGDDELLAAAKANSLLEKHGLHKIIEACRTYLETDRKDIKKLFRLVYILEKIRKEIQ